MASWRTWEIQLFTQTGAQLLRKKVSESEKVWDSTDLKAARTCSESLCYYGASVQNVQLITHDMQVFKSGPLKISTGGGKYTKKKCLRITPEKFTR